MELSDKNEVKIGFVEKCAEKFKHTPRESVGCFIKDDCLYAALMFFEEEWRLLEVCKVESDGEFDEEIAKVLDSIFKRNGFKDREISLIVPGKYLFQREFTLDEAFLEDDVRDIAYWDFQEKYFTSKKFSVAYYKLQDMTYFVSALEENEQKRIDVAFKQQNIFVSNWMILPEELDFKLSGNVAEIAGVSLEVPIDANIVELEEGAPAIFAAMVGAGLIEDAQNLKFPSLYVADSYDWKRIAAMVLVVSFVLFGSIVAFDMVRIHYTEKEVYSLRHKIENFTVDKTRMRLFSEIADDTNLREKLIAEKTRERTPLYGVLTHLGTLTEEGVIVKSVKTREKNVEIECEALSKQAMENFLENLSERQDLLISSPKALKMSENIKVEFSFSIDLRGK